MWKHGLHTPTAYAVTAGLENTQLPTRFTAKACLIDLPVFTVFPAAHSPSPSFTEIQGCSYTAVWEIGIGSSHGTSNSLLPFTASQAWCIILHGNSFHSSSKLVISSYDGFPDPNIWGDYSFFFFFAPSGWKLNIKVSPSLLLKGYYQGLWPRPKERNHITEPNE